MKNDDFFSIMGKLSINLTNSDRIKIIENYSIGTGFLDINKFIQDLEEKNPELIKEKIEQKSNIIKNPAQIIFDEIKYDKNPQKIADFFMSFDREKKNFFNYEDFTNILKYKNIFFEYDDMELIMKNIDPNNSEKILISELIEYFKPFIQNNLKSV